MCHYEDPTKKCSLGFFVSCKVKLSGLGSEEFGGQVEAFGSLSGSLNHS